MKTPNRLLIVAFLIFTIIGCEKEKIVSETELPSSVRTYLNNHFATCSVTNVIQETKKKKVSHDVTLDCGVNIEFNSENNAVDIDGKSELPSSVIPSAILSYTAINYPNDYIVGWELEGNNQHIDLNRAITLEFDSEGNYIKIVD